MTACPGLADLRSGSRHIHDIPYLFLPMYVAGSVSLQVSVVYCKSGHRSTASCVLLSAEDTIGKPTLSRYETARIAERNASPTERVTI